MRSHFIILGANSQRCRGGTWQRAPRTPPTENSFRARANHRSRMWGERSVPSESERSEDEGVSGHEQSESPAHAGRCPGPQGLNERGRKVSESSKRRPVRRARGPSESRVEWGKGLLSSGDGGLFTCPPRGRRFKLPEILSPPIGTKDTTTLIDFLRHFSHQKTSYKIRYKVMTRMRLPVSKEFITKNPCQNIEITVERKLPSILSVDEVTRLITTTLKHDPELIPYLTVGIFGGLRPSSEIPTVKSSHFHFQQKQLYVNSPKVKKERFVPLSDNLIEWLTLYPIKNDSLIVTNHRSRFNRIKKQSGVKWSPDLMRHSFGSYFMGKNQNIYSCSEGMGNSPSVIKRFYQRPILSDDVERFWELSPKTMEKD